MAKITMVIELEVNSPDESKLLSNDEYIRDEAFDHLFSTKLVLSAFDKHNLETILGEVIIDEITKIEK